MGALDVIPTTVDAGFRGMRLSLWSSLDALRHDATRCVTGLGTVCSGCRRVRMGHPRPQPARLPLFRGLLDEFPGADVYVPDRKADTVGAARLFLDRPAYGLYACSTSVTTQ